MSKAEGTLRERVKVIDNGRITIPKAIRDKLDIRDGAILEVYTVKDKIVLEVLVR
jgi:AbrB family looped-hinge helix DNA binding protein